MTRETKDTPELGRHRVLALALGVAGCAVVLTACGSSGTSSNPSSAQTSGIKFAECMRSHGVPNFPDPSGGGGGIHFDQSSGINPQSPAFRSAQTACAKFLPGGGPGGGRVSESRKLAMLRLAECMRTHGVSSFPDPTAAPPAAPPSGGGIAFGTPGAFLSVSQSLMQSPAFKSAAAECNFPGAGRDKAQPAPAPG